MFQGFEEGRIDVGDVEIAYAKAGEGPPVLLLHGYPQTRAMWAKVAPRLAERFTVVCADLRGYGDSDKPKCLPDRSNYAFRAMAEDQVRLMKALGFERFHAVGHDRGGRTVHRMTLDNPDAVRSMTVMDIVPTYTMFTEVNRHVAGAYWHWYFLSQPEPFPEHMIGKDPDFFYQTCLVGWGAAKLEDFDGDMLAAYRRAWRTPEMIHGSCSDYRAAASIDLDHDAVDVERKVDCPSLVLYGASGTMAAMFDIPAEWRRRCANVRGESVPGGHFFVDEQPVQTSELLLDFLGSVDRG